MKMLKLLRFDHDIPISDTTACANGYYTMDQAAKGRASCVVQSEMVRQWLGSAWSGCLLVQGNSDASLAISPLSLLCAKAIGIFSARKAVFVLRYFCGLHTRISKARDDATGMMNNLLGQLILQSERLGMDLDLADFGPEDLRGAKEDHLPSLLAMFRKCILRIPYAYTIYCIIDGISFYETSQRRDSTLDVLHRLRRIITKAKDGVFKLLVTAPGRTRSVHRLFERDEILHVPEYVQSDAQGFLDDSLAASPKSLPGDKIQVREISGTKNCRQHRVTGGIRTSLGTLSCLPNRDGDQPMQVMREIMSPGDWAHKCIYIPEHTSLKPRKSLNRVFIIKTRR